MNTLQLSESIVQDPRASLEMRAALLHLQRILKEYLAAHPRVTIAGMSSKCSVSEPTLRRIHSGQVKTLPSASTVVNLLMYISKETTSEGLLSRFPGPIANYLKIKIPQIESKTETDFAFDLTATLKDPVKYLIYKLCANPCGVSVDKVIELFGSYGESQLLALLRDELIELRDDRYFSKIENFCLSNDVFVEHFKSTAEFIKPHKHALASKKYSPVFSNYSSSVSKKAYAEIAKVQRVANRKILDILDAKENEGPIPVFILNAIDTLDTKCADEFNDPTDTE